MNPCGALLVLVLVLVLALALALALALVLCAIMSSPSQALDCGRPDNGFPRLALVGHELPAAKGRYLAFHRMPPV